MGFFSFGEMNKKLNIGPTKNKNSSILLDILVFLYNTLEHQHTLVVCRLKKFKNILEPDSFQLSTHVP